MTETSALDESTTDHSENLLKHSKNQIKAFPTGDSLNYYLEPDTADSLTDPPETHRRRGILTANAELQNPAGKFETIQALYDTCAGRPVVERDSRFILEGRAKKRALRRKLYYTEDSQLWQAVNAGSTASVKTLHAVRSLTRDDLAVVCIRLNGRVIHAIAIVAEKGTLPPGNDLIVDVDTLRTCKIDVTRLLR